MPDRRPEPAKPSVKPEPDTKKKTETTILTPEELRAISGGLGSQQPPSGPQPNVLVKKP